MGFWKVLEIINYKCNYRCIYCHNEGQHVSNLNVMKFEDMKKVVTALEGTSLKEIRFSGGEPFVNSETIKMIGVENSKKYSIRNWMCYKWELLNENIIRRLAEYKIKVTLHFAASTPEGYRYVTGAILVDLLKILIC